MASCLSYVDLDRHPAGLQQNGFRNIIAFNCDFIFINETRKFVENSDFTRSIGIVICFDYDFLPFGHGIFPRGVFTITNRLRLHAIDLDIEFD